MLYIDAFKACVHRYNIPMTIALVISMIGVGAYYSWHWISEEQSPKFSLNTDFTISASEYSLVSSTSDHLPAHGTSSESIALHESKELNESIEHSGRLTDLLIDIKQWWSSTTESTVTTHQVLAHKPVKLTVNRDLRLLFDSILQSRYQKDLPTLEKAISEHLGQLYSQEDQLRAKQLFLQYVAYRKQLDQIPTQGNSIQAMTDFFQLSVKLRRQVLGTTLADTYFAEDESYDRFTLARQHILNNPNLSELEKNLLVNRLENTLPAKTLSAPASATPSDSSSDPTGNIQSRTQPDISKIELQNPITNLVN